MRSLTIWLMVIAFFAAAVEVSISPQPSFRVALEDLCLSLWDNGLDLCGPRPAESGDVEEGGGRAEARPPIDGYQRRPLTEPLPTEAETHDERSRQRRDGSGG